LYLPTKAEIANIDDFPAITDEEINKIGRLPPGQRLVTKFPILSIDETPSFDPEKDNWNVEITGLVEKPQKWNWKEFIKLPKTELTTDFHCVTGWSKFDIKWGGVSFKTICELTKPLSTAIAVTSYGNQFYTSSCTIKDMLEGNTILAYELQGEPLDPDHGGPVRLIVPKIYAYKSTKWLKRLDFTAEWERGFWEQRGYNNRANPWLEERYASQEKPQRAKIQKEFKKLSAK
jgi:DMSO/TMAO reductase YedYZ molybdopterin-dependent catalytic subunit